MLSDTEKHGHQIYATPQERHQLGGFIGSSLTMRIAYDELERIATVNDTVLVLGESGTGKELAARAVHDLSARASDPFVIVDCAATSIANFERDLLVRMRLMMRWGRVVKEWYPVPLEEVYF